MSKLPRLQPVTGTPAFKRRLAGDTARSATSGEVQDLRREACALKEVVADLTLRLLKKSMIADGGEDE
jgi:transposase